MLSGSCTSVTTWLSAVTCSTAPSAPSVMALPRRPRAAMTIRHCHSPTSARTSSAMLTARTVCTVLTSSCASFS